VARRVLGKLHPARDVLEPLRQEGLTWVHLLRTLFSRRIQLHQWQTIKMWLYLGPSYLDCPASKELDAAYFNTQNHKVLDLGANLNPRVGHAHL
jgi:hypothetical protein